MSEQKQWGGKRQGAGRPKSLANPKPVTVNLEQEQIDWLDKQGERSEVLRKIIEQAMKSE